MRTRSTLAVASVVTSLLAFGAPAEAVQGQGSGNVCGLTAASVDGGGTWAGVIFAGPWQAQPSYAPVSMRCDLQRWTGDTWETIASVESPPTPGTTVLPPQPVDFHVPIDALDGILPDGTFAAEIPTNLQMCTQITVFRDPQVPDVYLVDADDDPTNGAQCEKEERADGELVYVTVFPPHPSPKSERCVWVDPNSVPPQVPDETCVPLPY